MARLRPIERTPDPPPAASEGVSEDVTCLARTVSIRGEITASEHLIIDGRFDGKLTVLEHGVAIRSDASVTADVVARTVTVLGRVSGTLTASDLVEIRASGSVEGRIVAPSVAIDEGAYFKGSVDPHRAKAAVAVTRHRQRRRA